MWSACGGLADIRSQEKCERKRVARRQDVWWPRPNIGPHAQVLQVSSGLRSSGLPAMVLLRECPRDFRFARIADLLFARV